VTDGGAVILAGGQSVRMGFDKQLLRIGGVRIIDGMISKLSAEFTQILVSTNKPELYKNIDCRVLGDTIGKGPLAGIYMGLKCCVSDNLYVTACDMPFISLDYIRYVKQLTVREGQFDAYVAKRPDGYYEPFNAFYNKSALKYIEEAVSAGRYGINRLLDKMSLRVISPGEAAEYGGFNMFFNANYKEDLEQLYYPAAFINSEQQWLI